MRVMITGADGFLGRALQVFLHRERPAWKIRGLDVRTARRGCLRVDLTDPRAAAAALCRTRPDVVFHLAGGTPAMDAQMLWRCHAHGTLGLFQALQSMPCRIRPRVVSIGSAHEYGPRSGRALRESDPAMPVAPYGFSKLGQTHLALAYSALGLDIVVARLFNLLSPELPPHHALSSFCRQAALIERGSLRALTVRGDLLAVRDFLSSDDAFRALVLLALHGKSGRIYNVCSGSPIRMSEALSLILRLASVRIPLPKGRRRSSDDVLYGSNARIRRETGWSPRESLGDGLRELLGRWRETL